MTGRDWLNQTLLMLMLLLLLPEQFFSSLGDLVESSESIQTLRAKILQTCVVTCRSPATCISPAASKPSACKSSRLSSSLRAS